MGRISSCFMIFKSGGTLKYEMIQTMLTHICCPGRTLLVFKVQQSYKELSYENSLFVMFLKNKCLFDVVLFHCLNKSRRLVLEAWVV